MGKISAFVVGAAIGAAAALLLAPKTGEQSRAIIVEKAGAVASEAKDFGAGMPGSAQDAFKTAQTKGSDFIQGAKQKGQSIASEATNLVKGPSDEPTSSPENDELREKIEAARQRIAAQVIENAEESKAAVGNVEEAVAETTA